MLGYFFVPFADFVMLIQLIHLEGNHSLLGHVLITFSVELHLSHKQISFRCWTRLCLWVYEHANMLKGGFVIHVFI